MKLLVASIVFLGLMTGQAAAQCCGDCDGDGEVRINELIRAVNNSLDGCPAPTDAPTHTPAPTDAPTHTPAPTDTPTHTPAPTDTPTPTDGQRFVDNGDGTVSDRETGLMWEKKDDSRRIHDKDNGYTWCGASCGETNEMDGTILTVFLDTLNDFAHGGASCFAGYCDWRVPNRKELTSILDLEVFSPAVDPIFHQSATCEGCTDVTLASCSCIAGPAVYWSSTSYALNPSEAWSVGFVGGFVFNYSKSSDLRVRAVRGGL